jgi:hypothetical protein
MLRRFFFQIKHSLCALPSISPSMTEKRKTLPVPVFDSNVIDSDRSDGYWVETFQFSKDDKVPGVIT